MSVWPVAFEASAAGQTKGSATDDPEGDRHEEDRSGTDHLARWRHRGGRGVDGALVQPELGQAIGSMMAGQDAMLLGRVTHVMFAAHWPHQTNTGVAPQ
jgi:hypothetical protein